MEEKMSYEQALARLEQIIRAMENDKIPLEESFRIKRPFGMPEIFFVEILFAIHEFGFSAQGNGKLPRQRLRRALDGVIRLFKVDIHCI